MSLLARGAAAAGLSTNPWLAPYQPRPADATPGTRADAATATGRPGTRNFLRIANPFADAAAIRSDAKPDLPERACQRARPARPLRTIALRRARCLSSPAS